MKTIISILALLIISLSISAQTAIKKSNISSGGAVVSNGTTKVIYTVGEFAVQENTQGTVHISEGFISPDMLIATEIKDYSQTDFNITLFPNPATEFVNIKFSDTCNYQIKLLNMQGKELLEMSGAENFKKIPLQNLSVGEYILLIKNTNDKQCKVFKLLKE